MRLVESCTNYKFTINGNLLIHSIGQNYVAKFKLQYEYNC